MILGFEGDSPLFEKAMCDLGVEDSIAMYPVLPHKGAGVFAKIVEYLDDLAVLQNLLQFWREWIDLGEIENVAVAPQSNLNIYG